jgi:protease-4
MRALLVLLKNLATALLVASQGLARWLLRPRAPDYVLFELGGDLPYRGRFARPGTDDPWWVARSPWVRSIDELRRRLRAVAEAKEVTGVVFRLRGLQCGLERIAELRRLVAELRADGKRVLFHADEMSNREYLLACAGDAVWLTPGGHLALAGLAAESLTFAGALEKAGVQAQVVRRGAYKTAAETFSHREPSPEQKETLNRLLDQLFEEWVRMIGSGRKLAPEEVKRRIDGGPYGARSARDAGLVDGLCHADELYARLAPEGRKRARIAPYAALAASRGHPFRWDPVADPRPRVLIVPVVGTITGGRSQPAGPMRSAGAETLKRVLERARRDPGVRSVVLHVDSRGGSALASDLIHRAVKKLRARKPVVAYLEDVAASGGYFIACGAQRIYASPTCVTGSIGVFSVKMEASALLSRLEVGRAEVLRGANAGFSLWTRPWTESERAAMERNVQEVYDDFLDAVVEGRGLARDKVLESAEGRVFLAGEAQGRGLLDALGPLDAALDEARRLAGIGAEQEVRWQVAAPPTPRWLRGGLFSFADGILDLVRDGVLAIWPWALKY